MNSPMQEIAKELKIRKRIESIYNSIAEDFSTKEEYDAFLEEREDIVFNLLSGVDVAETELTIERYQRANQEQILRNQARQAEASRLLTATNEAITQPQPPAADDTTYKAANVPAATMTAVPQLMDASPSSVVDLSDRAAIRAMGIASGWSPHHAVQRAMHEAFSQVFCCRT